MVVTPPTSVGTVERGYSVGSPQSLPDKPPRKHTCVASELHVDITGVRSRFVNASSAAKRTHKRTKTSAGFHATPHHCTAVFGGILSPFFMPTVSLTQSPLPCKLSNASLLATPRLWRLWPWRCQQAAATSTTRPRTTWTQRLAHLHHNIPRCVEYQGSAISGGV